MAIQISGTTVVNNSRELQNIASLDSTTTATIQAASGGPSDFVQAHHDIDYQTESQSVIGSTVTFKGNNTTLSDATLKHYTFDDVTLPFTAFHSETFGAPNTTSFTQSEHSGSDAKNWDGGTYTKDTFNNSFTSIQGSYAQYYQNVNSVMGTYNYSSTKSLNAFAYGAFSTWYPHNLKIEAYISNSWTQVDNFDPRVTGSVWREFSPVSASSMRWTATTATNNFVFYEMQFAGSTSASGKTATTPHASVASVGNSVTAYVLVKGTSSSWNCKVSRNGGTTFTSSTTTTIATHGDFYVLKLTYNLGGTSNTSQLGMQITFPNNGVAQFYGCKIEG